MASGIQLVQTVTKRGVFIVQGMGRAPKGQQFIIEQIPLSTTPKDGEKFKAEQKAAVEKLLGSGE